MAPAARMTSTTTRALSSFLSMVFSKSKRRVDERFERWHYTCNSASLQGTAGAAGGVYAGDISKEFGSCRR